MPCMRKKQKLLNVAKKFITKVNIEVEAIGKTAEEGVLKQIKKPKKVKLGGALGFKK